MRTKSWTTRKDFAMYSLEQRRIAIELYIKYDLQVNPVVKELGYPSRRILYKWYKEYLERGGYPQTHTKKSPYSYEKRKYAVEYYMEHGKSLANTIRKLGYPTHVTLRSWITEMYPDTEKRCDTYKYKVRYSYNKKKKVLLDHCKRSTSSEIIAKSHGVPRTALYRWEKELLSMEGIKSMRNQRKSNKPLESVCSGEKLKLDKEIEKLKQEIFDLKLECDILKKTSEVLKK